MAGGRKKRRKMIPRTFQEAYNRCRGHRRSDRWLIHLLLVVTCFFLWTMVQLWNVSYVPLEHSPSSRTKKATTKTGSLEESMIVPTQHDLGRRPIPFQSGHSPKDPILYEENIFCVNNNNKNNEDGNEKGAPISDGQHHPILLWGIPSTMADKEVQRRKLLRSTYLNFYNDYHPPPKSSSTSSSSSTGNSSSSRRYYEPNRICSLQEWTCQYNKLRNKCQLIYVFFIGGGNNETAPPYILDESLMNFRQMLIPHPPSNTIMNDNDSLLTEPGVVYLNIRENQFDGKMTTWFQFAALVGNEYPEIDYTFKVDSDLLLLTPNFMDYMDRQHRSIIIQREKMDPSNQHKQQQLEQQSTTSNPTTISRVYGGVEFPDINCEMNKTFDHPCPLPLVGRSYMSGELNFMSMDLARYIASDDCPRYKLTIPHEDVSLSNYVYSYMTNHIYHNKRAQHQKNLLGNIQGGDDTTTNTTIDIISVKTSQILLTTDTLADWNRVNLIKQPNLFGYLLWGHSIQRGKHRRYLIWKQDHTFQQFWNRFMRAYTGLMGGTLDKSYGDKTGGTATALKNNNRPGIKGDTSGTTTKRMSWQKVVNKKKG